MTVYQLIRISLLIVHFPQSIIHAYGIFIGVVIETMDYAKGIPWGNIGYAYGIGDSIDSCLVKKLVP